MKGNPSLVAKLAKLVYEIHSAQALRVGITELRGDFGDNFIAPNESAIGTYGAGMLSVNTRGGIFIIGKNQLKGMLLLFSVEHSCWWIGARI